MDIWALYETYPTKESRDALSVEQRQLLAVCDFRQEVNSGGFDGYLRSWGADTSSEALAILPRALGESWSHVLTEALSLLGAGDSSTADDRSAALDRVGAADDLLDQLDERFYELEGTQDADRALGDLALELGLWPAPQADEPKRRLWGRRSS